MSYNPSSAIIGEIRTFAGFATPAGWLFPVGQSLSRATYAALFATLTTSSTVTFTNGGGSLKCTWTGHPFLQTSGAVYTAISFTAGTSTPTGITAGTVYYVLPNDTTTFFLSTTPGGSAIAYTNSGTGTQTATAIFYGAADSTHFNLPDCRGRVAAFRDNMGGSAAGRLTHAQTQGVNGIILGASGGEEGHILSSPDQEVADIFSVTTTAADSNAYDPTTNAPNAHNNVQPTIILNAIIYAGV